MSKSLTSNNLNDLYSFCLDKILDAGPNEHVQFEIVECDEKFDIVQLENDDNATSFHCAYSAGSFTSDLESLCDWLKDFLSEALKSSSFLTILEV